MSDNENRIISGPDENGVRYYNLGNGQQEAGVSQTVQSQGQDTKPKKKNRKIIRNIAIILAIVIFCAFALSMCSGGDNSDIGIAGVDPGNSPYIATLYVEGTIQNGNEDVFGTATGYQHKWTLEAIDDLMYDENNYGLIIFVDSPGGGVYESDELYFKIKEYQEYTGNPVYSVMGATAASGGYYISAPCDRIFANRNTWTGSIGVTIGTLVDVSGLLEQYGVRTETITSGEHKAMGSSYQKMTDEEKAIWQSLVDEAYAQFAGIVAEGRDLDLEYVYEIADGRILSAYQAIELGLVDEIGGIKDAYDAMLEELDYYEPELIDIRYPQDHITFSTLLGKISAANDSDEEIDSVIELVNSINTTPISYYCEILAE